MEDRLANFPREIAMRKALGPGGQDVIFMKGEMGAWGPGPTERV